MILTFKSHAARDRSHARACLSLTPPVLLRCLSCQKSKHIEEPKISEKLSVFFVVELKKICQMYYDRVYLCEGQKWDLEREVRKRDYEVQEKWKAATTANNARRKRATVRSHVSFDHFLSRCRHPLPPVYQTIRASPFSSHGLSLRVVSRSPPIPLSVHTFLFRLLFSLSRCFSWQKTYLRRERKFAPGREPMGKVPTMETRGRTFNDDILIRWLPYESL